MTRITYLTILILIIHIASCNVKKPSNSHHPLCRFDIYVETHGQQDGAFQYTLNNQEKQYLMRFDSLSLSDPFIILSKVKNGVPSTCFSIISIEDTITLEINLNEAQHSYIKSSERNIGSIILCDFHISELHLEITDTIVFQAKFKKQFYNCVYGFRCCGVSDCSGNIVRTMNNSIFKEYVYGHNFMLVPESTIVQYEVTTDRHYSIIFFMIQVE